MLREERLQYIIERLQKDQRVSSPRLMEELQVSEGTIRRDLNELESKGLLKKVHGGAIPRPEAPSVFNQRMDFASSQKNKLAAKAIEFVQEGQLILMDGGTTNWHIAKLIPRHLNIKIFTNSIPVANLLTEHPSAEIHLMGGEIFKSSRVSVGNQVLSLLDRLQADICFMGIRSIHHEIGLTTLDWNEAQVKSKMTEVSNKLIVLATRDKLDTADHYKICDYEDLDILIVEEDIDEEILKPYAGDHIKIIK